MSERKASEPRHYMSPLGNVYTVRKVPDAEWLARYPDDVRVEVVPLKITAVYGTTREYAEIATAAHSALAHAAGMKRAKADGWDEGHLAGVYDERFGTLGTDNPYRADS